MDQDETTPLSFTSTPYSDIGFAKGLKRGLSSSSETRLHSRMLIAQASRPCLDISARISHKPTEKKVDSTERVFVSAFKILSLPTSFSLLSDTALLFQLQKPEPVGSSQ